jgi:hypothetical protein
MAAAGGLGVDASVQELLRVISGFLDDEVRFLPQTVVSRVRVGVFTAQFLVLWASALLCVALRDVLGRFPPQLAPCFLTSMSFKASL